MKIAILVNKSANNRKSATKWKKFIKHLDLLDGNEIIIKEFYIPFNLHECISQLINEEKVFCFVSAGGDGSVNYLLNILIDIVGERIDQFAIGGIGLGSSNDFIKPWKKTFDHIPARIDINNHVLHDIGLVKYKDEKGEYHQRKFIINSSVGLLACANYLFNKGDLFINFFKNKALDSTINYTALKTLLLYKASKVKINTCKEQRTIKLTNLSVVKNPNVSGSFKYNQVILPDCGSFGLNYCHDLNFVELIKAIVDLKREDFVKEHSSIKRCSYLSTKIRITSGEYQFLEMDGEATKANEIDYSVFPHRIKVLGIL